MQGVLSAACWSRNGEYAADRTPCSGGPGTEPMPVQALLLRAAC